MDPDNNMDEDDDSDEPQAKPRNGAASKGKASKSNPKSKTPKSKSNAASNTKPNAEAASDSDSNTEPMAGAASGSKPKSKTPKSKSKAASNTKPNAEAASDSDSNTEPMAGAASGSKPKSKAPKSKSKKASDSVSKPMAKAAESKSKPKSEASLDSDSEGEPTAKALAAPESNHRLGGGQKRPGLGGPRRFGNVPTGGGAGRGRGANAPAAGGAAGRGRGANAPAAGGAAGRGRGANAPAAGGGVAPGKKQVVPIVLVDVQKEVPVKKELRGSSEIENAVEATFKEYFQEANPNGDLLEHDFFTMGKVPSDKYEFTFEKDFLQRIQTRGDMVWASMWVTETLFNLRIEEVVIRRKRFDAGQAFGYGLYKLSKKMYDIGMKKLPRDASAPEDEIPKIAPYMSWNEWKRCLQNGNGNPEAGHIYKSIWFFSFMAKIVERNSLLTGLEEGNMEDKTLDEIEILWETFEDVGDQEPMEYIKKYGATSNFGETFDYKDIVAKMTDENLFEIFKNAISSNDVTVITPIDTERIFYTGADKPKSKFEFSTPNAHAIELESPDAHHGAWSTGDDKVFEEEEAQCVAIPFDVDKYREYLGDMEKYLKIPDKTDKEKELKKAAINNELKAEIQMFDQETAEAIDRFKEELPFLNGREFDNVARELEISCGMLKAMSVDETIEDSTEWYERFFESQAGGSKKKSVSHVKKRAKAYDDDSSEEDVDNFSDEEDMGGGHDGQHGSKQIDPIKDYHEFSKILNDRIVVAREALKTTQLEIDKNMKESFNRRYEKSIPGDIDNETPLKLPDEEEDVQIRRFLEKKLVGGDIKNVSMARKEFQRLFGADARFCFMRQFNDDETYYPIVGMVDDIFGFVPKYKNIYTFMCALSQAELDIPEIVRMEKSIYETMQSLKECAQMMESLKGVHEFLGHLSSDSGDRILGEREVRKLVFRAIEYLNVVGNAPADAWAGNVNEHIAVGAASALDIIAAYSSEDIFETVKKNFPDIDLDEKPENDDSKEEEEDVFPLPPVELEYKSKRPVIHWKTPCASVFEIMDRPPYNIIESRLDCDASWFEFYDIEKSGEVSEKELNQIYYQTRMMVEDNLVDLRKTQFFEGGTAQSYARRFIKWGISTRNMILSLGKMGADIPDMQDDISITKEGIPNTLEADWKDRLLTSRMKKLCKIFSLIQRWATLLGEYTISVNIGPMKKDYFTVKEEEKNYIQKIKNRQEHVVWSKKILVKISETYQEKIRRLTKMTSLTKRLLLVLVSIQKCLIIVCNAWDDAAKSVEQPMENFPKHQQKFLDIKSHIVFEAIQLLMKLKNIHRDITNVTQDNDFLLKEEITKGDIFGKAQVPRPEDAPSVSSLQKQYELVISNEAWIDKKWLNDWKLSEEESDELVFDKKDEMFVYKLWVAPRDLMEAGTHNVKMNALMENDQWDKYFNLTISQMPPDVNFWMTEYDHDDNDVGPLKSRSGKSKYKDAKGSQESLMSLIKIENSQHREKTIKLLAKRWACPIGWAYSDLSNEISKIYDVGAAVDSISRPLKKSGSNEGSETMEDTEVQVADFDMTETQDVAARTEMVNNIVECMGGAADIIVNLCQKILNPRGGGGVEPNGDDKGGKEVDYEHLLESHDLESDPNELLKACKYRAQKSIRGITSVHERRIQRDKDAPYFTNGPLDPEDNIISVFEEAFNTLNFLARVVITSSQNIVSVVENTWGLPNLMSFGTISNEELLYVVNPIFDWKNCDQGQYNLGVDFTQAVLGAIERAFDIRSKIFHITMEMQLRFHIAAGSMPNLEPSFWGSLHLEPLIKSAGWAMWYMGGQILEKVKKQTPEYFGQSPNEKGRRMGLLGIELEELYKFTFENSLYCFSQGEVSNVGVFYHYLQRFYGLEENQSKTYTFGQAAQTTTVLGMDSGTQRRPGDMIHKNRGVLGVYDERLATDLPKEIVTPIGASLVMLIDESRKMLLINGLYKLVLAARHNSMKAIVDQKTGGEVVPVQGTGAMSTVSVVFIQAGGGGGDGAGENVGQEKKDSGSDHDSYHTEYMEESDPDSKDDQMLAESDPDPDSKDGQRLVESDPDPDSKDGQRLVESDPDLNSKDDQMLAESDPNRVPGSRKDKAEEKPNVFYALQDGIYDWKASASTMEAEETLEYGKRLEIEYLERFSRKRLRGDDGWRLPILVEEIDIAQTMGLSNWIVEGEYSDSEKSVPFKIHDLFQKYLAGIEILLDQHAKALPSKAIMDAKKPANAKEKAKVKALRDLEEKRDFWEMDPETRKEKKLKAKEKAKRRDMVRRMKDSDSDGENTTDARVSRACDELTFGIVMIGADAAASGTARAPRVRAGMIQPLGRRAQIVLIGGDGNGPSERRASSGHKGRGFAYIAYL